jgi:hypothetical protein
MASVFTWAETGAAPGTARITQARTVRRFMPRGRASLVGKRLMR